MAYSSGNTQGNHNGKQENDDADDILSKMGVDDISVDASDKSDMLVGSCIMLSNTWWKQGLWLLAVLWSWGFFLSDNPEKVMQEETKIEQMGKQPINKPTLPSQLPPGQASFTSCKTPGKTETYTLNKTDRLNNNGYWALDVKYSDGYSASYVFWKNGTEKSSRRMDRADWPTHQAP